MSSELGQNVQVAVRMRPLNAEERRTGQPTAVQCDGENRSITVSTGPPGKKTTKTFNFDRVFGAYSTQDGVFDAVVRPIVAEVLEGYNCTVFAYGQTGTGKTHTMEGDIHSEADAGIVPRSVKTILETLEASGSEFTIRVSFLELYNEELQDLLVTPSQAASSEKKLKLCEDVKKGVVCQNLEEITVLNVKDIFDILQRGIKQRATAATLCNKNSSRSHSIFTMKIMIKECSVDGEEVVRHGQLNLVDLAGSECVGRSGAKNDRAKEAGSINQSLLTLGRVITALVDHHGHIPYRDSKLTRLLQESLGGKAKTCIIATLSPAQAAVEESLSTLDYAHRAKNIKNAPQLNQRMTKKVVLKEYCAEIETLRAQLQLTREKNGVYVDPNEYYAMESRISSQEAQLLECESALRQRIEEVKTVRVERDELHGTLDCVQKALDSATHQLQAAETDLIVTKSVLQETKLELTSTEAVVSAQVTTESSLHEQGAFLTNEVMARRSDRDNLLGKVERLVTGERSRQEEVGKFVAALGGRKERLVQQVENLCEQNAAQAAGLCDGVKGMLTKSRETCESLQGSIDLALSTLLKDSQRARDSMTSSCGQLETHLSETDSSLRAVLQGMQSKLSTWLGQVDESMRQTNETLSAQAAVMDVMESGIVKQAEELEGLNVAFLEDQKQRSERVTIAIKEVHVGIAESLQSHEEQVKDECLKAKADVEHRAAAMEKAVQSLLQDFISSSNASLSGLSAQTSKFTSSTTATLHKASASIAAQQTDMQASAEKSITAATKAASAASVRLQDSLKIAKEHQTTCSELVGGLSGAVAERRAVLDATINQVSVDISAAVSTGCESVRSTAATAGTMLQDVKRATDTMNSSSSAALKEFTSFIDSRGEEVCAGVTSHFAHLEEHLAAQQSELAGVGADVEVFSAAFDGAAVAATGRTPTKMSFSALGELARTRPHAEIKIDARSGVSVVSPESINLTISAPDAPVAVEEAVAVEDAVAISSSDKDKDKENENVPAAPSATTAATAAAAGSVKSRLPAKGNNSRSKSVLGSVESGSGKESVRGRTASASAAAPLSAVSLDADNRSK